jgi:hypothetical protein
MTCAPPAPSRELGRCFEIRQLRAKRDSMEYSFVATAVQSHFLASATGSGVVRLLLTRVGSDYVQASVDE